MILDVTISSIHHCSDLVNDALVIYRSDCETMSLRTDASYYRPALPTSDPFQFASGLYSSSDRPKFDVYDAAQSGMMYDDRQRGVSSSFFDTRCNLPVSSYECGPSAPYPATTTATNAGQYSIKTPLTTGELFYGQGLRRVHSQPTPVSHDATMSRPGFAIYPWMRSMTTGTVLRLVSIVVYC